MKEKNFRNLAESGDRLNKWLSHAGYCSRREADRLAEAGRVQINGTAAYPGSRIRPGDRITVDGKPVTPYKKQILLAFNKPRGIVCTTDSRREKNNIVDYIHYKARIYPVGRLDKDSEGLILLTNDGSLVNRILRARNYHEKEYIARTDRRITEEFMQSMAGGVQLEDVKTRPCEIRKIGPYSFSIVLTQGINRQIRRMCETLGYRVLELKRIRIMNIRLGRLKTGEYREVSGQELKELYALLGDSDE